MIATPAIGGLRAFAATTLAVAAAGAALAGVAIVRGLADAGDSAPRAAVGQVAATGFGGLVVGTVTSSRADALQVGVTLTNESADTVEIDPRAFRLIVPGRDPVEPARGAAPAGELGRLASAGLVLRFRAPGAGRARALEFRDPHGTPLRVDLDRVVVGGGAAGGRGGH